MKGGKKQMKINLSTVILIVVIIILSVILGYVVFENYFKNSANSTEKSFNYTTNISKIENDVQNNEKPISNSAINDNFENNTEILNLSKEDLVKYNEEINNSKFIRVQYLVEVAVAKSKNHNMIPRNINILEDSSSRIDYIILMAGRNLKNLYNGDMKEIRIYTQKEFKELYKNFFNADLTPDYKELQNTRILNDVSGYNAENYNSETQVACSIPTGWYHLSDGIPKIKSVEKSNNTYTIFLDYIVDEGYLVNRYGSSSILEYPQEVVNCKCEIKVEKSNDNYYLKSVVFKDK